MATQSLFKKFMHLFVDSKGNDISKSEAINLQQKYIADSCSRSMSSYPPYLEIAKQLDSPKLQIFNAALYYLEQIANNESDYSAEIVNLLTIKSKLKKMTPERRGLILQTLDKINKL
ncbi:MAG: hypothetical protein IJ778_03070 [Alphaproteobacteria bacterium]|nr:hypothetical protein [Alphaproteobacteria bacterium]